MKVRKLLVSVAAACALVLGGLAVWLMTLDPKDIVAIVERQAMQATGRSLHIDGPVSLQWSLIPTVAVEGVRFQNAPWGSQPDMLSVKRAEVQLALVPLFSGEIRIRKIVLEAPKILLEANAKGQKNWIFDKPAQKEETPSRKLSIDIAELRIEQGDLSYRAAPSGKATRLQIEKLQLQAAKPDTASIDGKFVINDIALALSGSVPSVGRLADDSAEGKGSMPLDIKLEALGVKMAIAGGLVLDQPSLQGTELKFDMQADDPAASAKQLGINVSRLPKTRLAGSAQLDKSGLHVTGMQLTSGKSNARGEMHMPMGKPRLDVSLKLDAPLIDLADLLGPAKTAPAKESKGGRLFSDAPLPLDGLNLADAKGDIKLSRVVLQDGRALQDVVTHFSLDKGRLRLEPLSLSVDGKPVRLQMLADASGGKSLSLTAAIDARAVPLASLAALTGVSATPQAAPTDLAIKLTSRGASVRQLMAGLNGDVRVVVGPGRWQGSAFELSPAIQTVADLIFPAAKRGEFTELQCAVFRFPLNQGVAKIDNGIGVETTRIKLAANGTVDMRSETLDLGVRPKAVTGANIDVGNLARLVRVRGTLAAPEAGVDAVGVATTALDVGIAMARGGKGLSKSVFADNSPDNPCQVALGQAAVRAGVPQNEPSADKGVAGTAKTVTDTLDAVRGLFGK